MFPPILFPLTSELCLFLLAFFTLLPLLILYISCKFIKIYAIFLNFSNFLNNPAYFMQGFSFYPKGELRIEKIGMTFKTKEFSRRSYPMVDLHFSANLCYNIYDEKI